MNYTDLAQKVSEDLINYPVKDESLMEVFDTICDKYNIDSDDRNIVLAKVTHIITVMGYDIKCTKPLKFESYL